MGTALLTSGPISTTTSVLSYHLRYTVIHSSLFGFLSQDGVKMTLVDQSSIPGDLLPATVIPGLEAFTTVTAGVGVRDYKTTY